MRLNTIKPADGAKRARRRVGRGIGSGLGKTAGTATRANDSVEDKAVYGMFGARPACSSTKGWTGHTLGAAGITEAVISALCLTEGLIPGTLNCARVDPSLKSRILRENQIGSLSCVASNIFGFGGNNCSLILGKL